MNNKITYFISGHRNITLEEFEKHYIPLLDKIIEETSAFVVGDYYGVDAMAQQYLKDKNIDDNRVTVYHMFTSPRNNAGFPTKGGFTSDEERDSAMTNASHFDIAWVHPNRVGKNSGTEQNIQRRKLKSS